MSELATIRQLKLEEKKIEEILQLFREQLYALKMEELELKSRIRDQNITMTTNEITQASIAVEARSETSKILNALASGGDGVDKEESDCETEEEDPLVSFFD
ncbi:hypothetical protein CHUAL_010474 [Chamberlinius hualienensis]